MMAFLSVITLSAIVVGGALWFYRTRIATTDAGAGTIVIVLLVLAMLMVVLIGAVKMAGER